MADIWGAGNNVSGLAGGSELSENIHRLSLGAQALCVSLQGMLTVLGIQVC